MPLSLNERKQQLVQQCLEEYQPKPRKWWQSQPDDIYKSTWDIYKEKNYPRVFADVIEIRSDFGSRIFAIIFLLIVFVFLLLMDGREKNIVGTIMAVLVAVALIFTIKSAADRKPKIVISKEGLWTAKWGLTIPWEDIVVSCIRENTSGESSSYYLRIHFYDPFEDIFRMKEYNMGDLEKEPETIACFVHQFRVDFGKASAEQ